MHTRSDAHCAFNMHTPVGKLKRIQHKEKSKDSYRCRKSEKNIISLCVIVTLLLFPILLHIIVIITNSHYYVNNIAMYVYKLSNNLILFMFYFS